ncbi:MAG TPA: nuclear transport factor 2 family protein [Gemmatimonadales bacterium]
MTGDRLRIGVATTTGILALLVSVFCLQAQDPTTSLLGADRATSQLSSDSGFSKAVLAALHPTGVLLWPGAPVIAGAADVSRFFGSLANQDSLRLTWQPLGIDLARDSSFGVTWGVAVATARLTTGTPQVGRYISAWRREPGRWTIAALLVVGITPTRAAASPSGFPLTREAARARDEIAPFIAADLAFARLAADSGAAIAFRRWAARDAVKFGGGGLLIRGPEAIAQTVSGPGRWQWHPVLAGAARSADLGWTVGEAVITGKNAQPAYSKYLTIWSRLRGGPVRFLIDGGNSRPPAP